MHPSFETPSDSSEISNVEYIDNDGFVAFDKNNKKLFTIFSFDNGPDYTSDGLFRIIENNKIGYANEQGKIIIQPQFSAALPFQNGLAAFCEDCITAQDGEHSNWTGGKWGFINKQGEIVIEPVYDKVISDFSQGYATVERDGNVLNINKSGNELEIPKKNYEEWIRLLSEAVKLSNKIVFKDQLIVDINFKPNYDIYNFYKDDPGIVEITIRTKDDKLPLINYLLIPWQNFALTPTDDLSISPFALLDILTVTDYAIIYCSGILLPESDINFQYAVDFENTFNKLIDYKENQNPEELESLNIPEGVQLISYEVFENYISLKTAIPGSRVVELSEWEKVSKDRMIYLQQIPDTGQTKMNWFKPSDPFYDPYYLAPQDDLISLFNNALKQAQIANSNRFEIYNSTREKIRELFNAANSYVNFLYDKYEKLLADWLQIGDTKIAFPDTEGMFGDYQPKLTPDTVIDYMPSIHDEYVNLPSPELNSLCELLNIFKKYKVESQKNPGHWVEGNVILGANPQEYHASKPELLLAETGKLIQYVIDNNSGDEIKKTIENYDFSNFEPEYKEFSFIHYDVMGSGRFFYIHGIEDKKLELP